MSELKPIVRGTTKTYNISLCKKDQPIPLFGLNLIVTLKKDQTVVDTQADHYENIIFPDNQDSTNGLYTYVLDSSESDLDAGEYYFSMKLVDSSVTPSIITSLMNECVLLEVN